MKNFKNVKKILFLLTVMCLLSVPVFAGTKKLNVKVATKTVNAKKTLAISTSTQLVVKDGKKTISASKVKFKSSKTSVATISKKGILKTKAVGKANITIIYGKKKGKLTVTVIRPVKSVNIDYNYLELKVGDTKTLKATVSPKDVTNKSITWKSSNTSVATVATNGTVTAKKTGSTIITATSNNGKESRCSIDVVKKTTSGGNNNNNNNGDNNGNNGGNNDNNGGNNNTNTTPNISLEYGTDTYYVAYIGLNDNDTFTMNKAILTNCSASDIEWKLISGSEEVIKLKPSGATLYGVPKHKGEITVGVYLKGNSKCYAQQKFVVNTGDPVLPATDVTVEGVTFDTYNVKDSYTLNDNKTSANFTIYTESNINSNDVSVKINGTNIETYINQGIP